MRGANPVLVVILVLAINAWSVPMTGQNLVPDPGFENWVGNPVAGNTMSSSGIWTSANGTPDHHHQLNPNGVNLTSLENCPLGNGQTQCGTPHGGRGVLGAYKANGVTGTKEWAVRQLSSPMAVGQTYRVGYWIQNKKDKPNFIMETNQWGIFFSTTAMPGFNPNTVSFASMSSQWVTCSQVIAGNQWQFLQWYFTPTQAYSRIYLGYVGDPANGTVNSWSSDPSIGFYVWIDDVVVELANTLPVELTDQDLNCTSNGGVRISWTTATELNNDRFEVLRWTAGGDTALVATVTGAGNSTEQRAYEVVDGPGNQGPRYYRLRQVDLDGSEHTWPVMAISCDATVRGLQVWPVPSYGAITVTGWGADRTLLHVFNSLGQLVLTLPLTESRLRIEGLATGVYALHALNPLGKADVGRCIVE